MGSSLNHAWLSQELSILFYFLDHGMHGGCFRSADIARAEQMENTGVVIGTTMAAACFVPATCPTQQAHTRLLCHSSKIVTDMLQSESMGRHELTPGLPTVMSSQSSADGSSGPPCKADGKRLHPKHQTDARISRVVPPTSDSGGCLECPGA